MRGLFLPLKLTGGVEIIKNFETHISKKSGPDSVPPVHATFEEMQKLRNGLDYNKMQLQLNNDYRLAPEFQVQIANYLRYVYLIDNFFKNEFNESKYLKLNFPWTDSFQPKKVKAINHIKYELASCLYNLAICYYTEGIHYTANPGAQEKLKGIAKLRTALWCINEIKQVLPSLLVNPNDLPSDLNLSYINLLHNYFIGLTYAALMEVMSADTKKNGPEKLASVNKAAAKHFQIAFDIIAAMKPCPIPDPQAKALRMNLLFNTIMFRSEAYFQMAQLHLAKVDEEIRGGHMGFAVSYIRITKFDFDEIFKNKKDLELLTPEQRAALADRAKIIQTNYDNCLLKNQRVYQQQEYNSEQLPEIPEEKAQITPIEPKDIKTKLQDERFFEVFLSPEILAIKGEFQNYVSMKMLEVENSLKNANNVKNKLYADGYVNYLLDLQSQTTDKKPEIPPHLKARIDRFKKNGGVNAYLFTKKNIVETSGVCAKTIQDIKGPLAAERDEDENLRKQFPGQWTRPYSEQVNQEYVLKLKDLEQKFFIAQNTDKDVMKKFDQYQDWMQKFSLPDDQILALIPRSSDNDFVAQSKPKLIEIAEINRKIIDLIDLERQRANLLAFTDEFMKTDFMSSFAGIHAKTFDKQQEFDKMLGPYRGKLSQVENQINEAYPLMDAISNQAKEMVASRGGANQSAVKILEEMNLAITVINDIFNDFQQGITFYGNLNFHLNTLQKVVNDYCLAREIEKSALLQELQAQKNYSNFNAQQPFFKDENLQFNQGHSVFVPGGPGPQTQNKGPGPQQQGYPQQQTQMYNPHQQQGQTQTQMYNPNQGQQQYSNNAPVQSQMGYMPPQNQGYNQTQAFYPQQGQTHTQMYNPNQGQQQYSNNAPVQSQMGYMPMPKPDNQPGPGQPQGQGQGQFGGFGNVVESTFIPHNQGNPYFQGKGPGQH